MAFATTVGSLAIRPSSVLQKKAERHEVKDKAQRETAMVGMTSKGGHLGRYGQMARVGIHRAKVGSKKGQQERRIWSVTRNSRSMIFEENRE